jgi:hypothetical protein
MDANTTMTKTNTEVMIASRRLGQVTFTSSWRTSPKKVPMCANRTNIAICRKSHSKQLNQERHTMLTQQNRQA